MPASPLSAEDELPLEWQVAPGVPAVPAPRHLRLVGEGEAPPAAGDRPAPTVPFVARMALACAEVGFGIRPSGQLQRWVARPQLAMLARHGECVARHPSSRRRGTDRTFRMVRGIRICRVSDDAYETSAVLVGATRSRAIAMRLEWLSAGWVVTAVQL